LGDYSDIDQTAAKIRKSRKVLGNLNASHISVGNKSAPALCIEEMNLNQQNPLDQSHEFIVTCLVVGGPDTEFRWYKDDFLVDTQLADRYMKVVVKDFKEVGPNTWERASMLTITTARKFDSGVFR
jgi:hypothetical protein